MSIREGKIRRNKHGFGGAQGAKERKARSRRQEKDKDRRSQKKIQLSVDGRKKTIRRT